MKNVDFFNSFYRGLDADRGLEGDAGPDLFVIGMFGENREIELDQGKIQAHSEGKQAFVKPGPQG
jgi:hypothetical protein